MRILGMMVMVTCLCLGQASGATVTLANGHVVQGDIIKQDNKSIQINMDGVNMTYYADEIKDIDGKPFSAARAAAAVAPAVKQGTGTQPSAVAPASVAPAPVARPITSNLVSTPARVSVAGETSSDKKDLILKFIDVFGTRQALTNNFGLMLKQIEKEKPDEAQKIRERVKVDEIINRLIPIYDRNFSTEDLKAFIAFYGSAEGQKLINTIPELMKESVKESVKYMEEKFPEVRQAK